MSPEMNRLLEADGELQSAVRRMRRRWRVRIVAEGVARTAAAVLLALLLGALVAAVAGQGSAAVAVMRVLGYLLIAAALVRYLLVPAFDRPGDARLALYIEERAPELKQALVSAMDELRTPAEARPSPGLSRRVVEQALAEIQRLESGPGLERSRLARAGALFAGVAAAAVLLLVVGPPVLKDAARALFIPWSEAAAAPVFAVQVTPGDADVPRGGAIEIEASLRGFNAEGAELVLRADTSAEWVRIPMLRDSADASFTARLFDLTRATEYYVESEGVRSRPYKLSITDLPAVSRLSLTLKFPAYTGLPPEEIENGGDVAAVSGTLVTVRVTPTRPVTGGQLRLDGGQLVPLTPDAKGQLTGSFRVTKDGFYRVDLVSEKDIEVPGAIPYAIEALDDHGPTVSIAEPGRDTKVTSVEEVAIAVRASDEYGVNSLELRYTVNGGPEQKVVLTDSAASRSQVELRAAHTMFLEELGLKAGDLVSYFARATDGAGNTASSDIYFLEVRPFGKDYRQADAGGGGGAAAARAPRGSRPSSGRSWRAPSTPCATARSRTTGSAARTSRRSRFRRGG